MPWSPQYGKYINRDGTFREEEKCKGCEDSDRMRRELLMGIAKGITLCEKSNAPTRPPDRLVKQVMTILRGLYGKYSQPTDVLR